MKKFLVVIVALMALSMSSASAQAVWGARIGVSRPTLSSEGDDWKGKFGLELGPVLYYSLKSNWYINTGAMFSFKKLSYEESGYDYYGSYSYKEDLSLIYVDIPVYAGYAFKAGKAALYAQAGPFVGFKLSEKWKINDDGDTFTDNEEYISVLNAGLGIMLGVNISRFKIEAGYQLGLANVLKEKDWGTMKANSIFLGIGYVF